MDDCGTRYPSSPLWFQTQAPLSCPFRAPGKAADLRLIHGRNGGAHLRSIDLYEIQLFTVAQASCLFHGGHSGSGALKGRKGAINNVGPADFWKKYDAGEFK